MEKMLIVYRAYFPTANNNKSYIGITSNFDKRKKGHLKDARLGSSLTFHRAIRKYGEPVFEILKECADIEDLKTSEKIYIEKFDSFLNGYNSTLGGDGTFGSKRPKSETWCLNHSKKIGGNNNPRFGYVYSMDNKHNHSKLMKQYYENNPNKKPFGNKSSLGLIWINNGIVESKINKYGDMPIGFQKGRLRNRRLNND